MIVLSLQNVALDSLVVFPAHCVGQKECGGCPGEDFSIRTRLRSSRPNRRSPHSGRGENPVRDDGAE